MKFYKKYIVFMLIISLILPNAMFLTAFAEDEIITTGAEFVEKVVLTNFGKTFKIEGVEDTDGNGTPDGIIIPSTYKSVNGFNGTIIGVDGKNNIQISKPLFESFSGTTTIENINLKPAEDTAFLQGTAQGYGTLVCAIDTDDTYNIKKVTNYCNISSSAYYLGGIIGKVTKGTLSLNLCANYGSVTGPSTSRYVGGLIGGLNGDVTFTVSKSFNAGEITGNRNTAGILGLVSVISGEISNCFNAGDVITSSGNAANGGAGIAVPTKACLTINNVYNVGNVSQASDSSINTSILSNLAYEGNVSSSENCYYIANTNASRKSIGTEITTDDLSKKLPDGFSDDWEFIRVEGVDDEYQYPQIKGNTYWNDYKYYFSNDLRVDLQGSNSKGEITELLSGWEKEDSVTDNTSVFMSSPLGYEISSYSTYGGVPGLSLLRAEMTSTSSFCSFKINKSAQIFIATDKNPSVDTVNAVNDGGFTQVFNSDNSPATVVTKGGAIFYLSSKSVVVSEGETVEINIANASDLDKAYFVLINWIDNATITFDLSGNENIYIDDELYQNTTYTVSKGSVQKIKIEPKQNYYIKDFIINGESEKQNIATYYETETLADKDMTIKVETAPYEFIDDNQDDDITYPFYQPIQEIDGSTGVTVQSVKAEGYLGEFLEGATVTLNIKKDGSPVVSAQGIVNRYGKVQIIAFVGNTEGNCTLNFTINVSGVENDIWLDDSKKTFKVPSVADVNNLILDINDSQITAGDLTALILEEKDTLAFETDVFKKLDPAIQNKITSDMVLKTDYNVSNLYARFDNFVIMNTLNMSKDSEDILRLLDTYVFETAIDLSELYDSYLLLKDKLDVCSEMLGITYANTSDILPQFEYAFVKNELNKAVSYDKIIDIIDDYDEILGIESLVAKAKDKDNNEQKVINEEIGNNLKDLTTKDLFIEKLEYTVDNSKKLLNDKTKPSVPKKPTISVGGGGGGSVSVGNDYIETPVVEPVENGGTDAFTDLGDVSWASDYINILFHKGIVSGKEQGKFYPQDNLTRAEFVKMAIDTFSLMEENPACAFTDVSENHWAYKYVASAAHTGIINGYSPTEFGINGNISRQDMIAILIRIIYRISKHEAMENRKNPDVTFTDQSDIADYALGGVLMFAGSGIISGYEDGSFGPTKDLTRAEAAVILAKVIEFFEI